MAKGPVADTAKELKKSLAVVSSLTGILRNVAGSVAGVASQFVSLGKTVVTSIGGIAVAALLGTAHAARQLRTTLTETVAQFQPITVKRFELAFQSLQAVIGKVLEPILWKCAQAVQFLADWILTFYERNKKLVDSVTSVIGDFLAWLVAATSLADILGFVTTVIGIVIGAILAAIATVLAFAVGIAGLIVSMIGLIATLISATVAMLGFALASLTSISPLLGLLIAMAMLGVAIGMVRSPLLNLNTLLERAGILMGNLAAKATEAAADLAGVDITKLKAEMLKFKKTAMEFTGKFDVPGTKDLKDSRGLGIRNVQEVQDAGSIGVEARKSMLGASSDPAKESSEKLKSIDDTMKQIKDGLADIWGRIKI